MSEKNNESKKEGNFSRISKQTPNPASTNNTSAFHLKSSSTSTSNNPTSRPSTNSIIQ